MSVKLKARLPKGSDGLQHLADRLRAEVEGVMVVALLVPSQVTENLDSDEDPYTVTLRIVQIEATDGAQAEQLRDLMGSAYELRTGKRPLPFAELGDDVTATLHKSDGTSIDLKTGEVLRSGSGVLRAEAEE